jgi:uncharacterized membrane protein
VNAYDLVKFAHVAGAITWIGSGIALTVLTALLRRTRDADALVAVGERSQALGNVLFAPAALVTLAAGVALVAMEPAFRFVDLWILIGFGGIAASGVAQMALAGPGGERFAALAVDRGLEAPETLAAARRMTSGNLADTGLLLVVVWAMVAKPVL